MVALEAVYDENEEQRRLLVLLAARYEALLRAVHGLVMDNLPGVTVERLPLPAEAIRRALALAVNRTLQIDATTQAAIGDVLRVGLERGYSAWEIAQGVPGDSFAGLRALYATTWKARPETIARTELAEALNHASLDRYAASGVVRAVQIVESEDTDEPCAERNGRVVPVESRPGLQHPRCRVGLVPVVDGAVQSGPAE